MHLKEGTLLHGGKYRIIRFISQGGFGCTYEGVHTVMGVRVAIKEFFVADYCERDVSTGNVYVSNNANVDLVRKLHDSFTKEARTVFEMNHPSIVRVSDIFDDNGTSYFVMDYIEGMSLHDMLQHYGPLSEDAALYYIYQVADALNYVHSLHRLHLDIKPANIMVTAQGQAILIDFGAAKHYDQQTHEQTSTLLGLNTCGYAPPEQMSRSLTNFSPATDIYALGVTLYKLLTGVTPPDSVSIASQEQYLQPLPEHISYPTRYAIEAAMQVIRTQRVQSIPEFIGILQSGQQASTNEVQQSSGKSGHKGLLITIIISLVCIFGVAAYLIFALDGDIFSSKKSSGKKSSVATSTYSSGTTTNESNKQPDALRTPSLDFAQVSGSVKSIEMTLYNNGYTGLKLWLNFDREGNLSSMYALTDDNHRAKCDVSYNRNGYPSGFQYKTSIEGGLPGIVSYEFFYKNGYIETVKNESNIWETHIESTLTFSNINNYRLPTYVTFDEKEACELDHEDSNGYWTCNYEYDSHNNWIRMTASGTENTIKYSEEDPGYREQSNSKISWEIRRKIEYY